MGVLRGLTPVGRKLSGPLTHEATRDDAVRFPVEAYEAILKPVAALPGGSAEALVRDELGGPVSELTLPSTDPARHFETKPGKRSGRACTSSDPLLTRRS
jgi:hypothetical protein